MATNPKSPGSPVTTTLVAYDAAEAKRICEVLRLLPGLTRPALLSALLSKGLAEVQSVEDVLELRAYFGPQARARLNQLVAEGVLAAGPEGPSSP
jgi:hypothetical protein